MNRQSIIKQLKEDYSKHQVFFDDITCTLKVDDKKINLMMDNDEMISINVNSHSGKNRYQAIVQLLYEKHQLMPTPNGLADKLVKYKEEYNKYKLQNLAKDYSLGFLEDGDNIVAIPVDADSDKQALIEEDANLKEKIKLTNLKKKEGIEDDFGYLYEIKDNFIPKERKDRRKT